MAAYYLWCLGFLFVPNLDAKSFKLVPGRTQTITKNGVTHERSRYMVVPDDQHNETIAGATKLLTANENGVNKETTDTNSDRITDNQRVKERTANETHTENVLNNIRQTLRMMRASQSNAGEYKSTGTPKSAEYESSYRSRSDSNINSDQKEVRIKNTKYNGRGSVEHTKATLNLKPQSKVSQSRVISIKQNNEKMDKYHGASESQNQFEIPVSKTISNLNVHTSESKEAGMNNFNAKEKLIEAIGVNKRFTIPGRRGRYTLLYEDHENDHEKINTIHYSRQPKQNVSHFNGTKYMRNPQKDFSLGSLKIATRSDSVPKTNLDENIKHNNLNIINNVTSSFIDNNNVSIVGKINSLREDSENKHLDQILSESQNNFVSTEPTSNETMLHNARVFQNKLNVIPLTDNNKNSQNDLNVLPLEINNTTNSNRISAPEDSMSPLYDKDILLRSISDSTTTQDSETLNQNTKQEHEVESVSRQDLEEQQMQHQLKSVQRKYLEEQQIKHQVESVQRKNSEEQEIEHEEESVSSQDLKEQQIKHKVESVQRNNSDEQKIEHQVESVQRKDSEKQEIEHEVESVSRQDLEEQQIEHQVESVQRKHSEEQEIEHEVESVQRKDGKNQHYTYDENDGKALTPVQMIYSDENNNFKNEYPIHMQPNRGYSPDYTPALSPFPYRFYVSQNAYSQPNYSNHRSAYVLSEHDFQKILTFLASEKVMQKLRLKYEIGYGDTDTIRKSHIIEQLRNLGLENINSIQLFILSQLVRHLEVNKKYNQTVSQDSPKSIAYYYMPHAVLRQNYAQRYMLPNVYVKFNTALRTLISKAMNIATYLRTRGVPKSQVSFYLAQVHKYLNNYAIQSFLKNCRKRIVTELDIKIDFLARQAMMSAMF